VERGQEAGTHQSIGGGTSPFIGRCGHLDFQRAGSWLEVGLSPGLSPLFAFPVEVPLLSTAVGPSQVGPSLRAVMRSWCFLSFSLLSNVPVIVYRHG
jgi:hypothetical protein